MSEVTLLRTLTEKSVLKFGKYADVPISNIIALGHNRYLRWIYYNMSNISFMPDVLEKIGVKPEHIINKPGKDEDLYNLLNEEKDSKMSGIMKYRFQKCQKIQQKRKSRNFLRTDRVIFSKANLARKNHGH